MTKLKKPDTYEDIGSIQDVADRGDIAVVFVSEDFWYGRCVDEGCHNLHVLCREVGRPFEIAMTFSCQHLEDMLHTARLIKRRHGN